MRNRNFRSLMRDMDSLFNRFYEGNLLDWDQESKGLTKWGAGFRAPMCDVRETENNVIADIEIPGANKEDIDLNVTDTSIEVKTEKQQEKEKEENGSYTYTSSRQSYYRVIPCLQKLNQKRQERNIRTEYCM